jgi:predicted 3-demethylubiquinone-9 3-methyltransferase (glyoxalase superfamily)
MKTNIYPCLWFDSNGREAAEFYCSVFKGSSIKSDNQFVVMLEAAGQKFMLLSGGPIYKVNPSVSFYVLCETVEEIDSAWVALIDGGIAIMPLGKYPWSSWYGWVQDKYGVSWQLTLGKMEDTGQKFTPSMMFTEGNVGKAEEAVSFYTSVFEGTEIKEIHKYTSEDKDTEGNVKHAQFKLRNKLFMAMDSSLMHGFTFDEGISFVVECDTQDEIDYFWEKLTEGGEEIQCGWLRDKYGFCWQIIPSILDKLMSDPAKSERVVSAFMKMKKFEIDKLINA